MGYSLCMMADFQNALISRIFGVFWSGFFYRTTHFSNNFLVFFGAVFWSGFFYRTTVNDL